MIFQYTDTELILPAKADQPEVRVRLPNRREKTFEEREAVLEERKAKIAALEEEIEAERKDLKAKVDAFQALGTGGSEIIVQNLKLKTLMERRSALARPEKWVEELEAGPKSIFLEKHDLYRLNRMYFLEADVYELVRRREALDSLYVDVGLAAAAEARAQEEAEGAVLEAARVAAAGKTAAAAEAARAATELPGGQAPRDAAAAARTGAIVGQKRVIRLGKKSAGAGAAGGSSAAGGGPGGI